MPRIEFSFLTIRGNVMEQKRKSCVGKEEEIEFDASWLKRWNGRSVVLSGFWLGCLLGWSLLLLGRPGTLHSLVVVVHDFCQAYHRLRDGDKSVVLLLHFSEVSPKMFFSFRQDKRRQQAIAFFAQERNCGKRCIDNL